MATQQRKDATSIANVPLPQLPSQIPSDWSTEGSFKFARAIVRALYLWQDIIFRIQDADDDLPLRAKLSFVGASLTDDLENDRLQVSIGGGAGAAPVNAEYLVVSLNGTLSQERVAVAGAGIASVDGGAGGNFTLSIGAGTGISVGANDVGLDTASSRNTDHSGVTITAGAGLTGGGDISATRTLDVGAGTGITVNANDVAWNGVTVRQDTGSDVGTRRRINFINGGGCTVTVTDSPGTDEINVTISVP